MGFFFSLIWLGFLLCCRRDFGNWVLGVVLVLVRIFLYFVGFLVFWGVELEFFEKKVFEFVLVCVWLFCGVEILENDVDCCNVWVGGVNGEFLVVLFVLIFKWGMLFKDWWCWFFLLWELL